jgi:hypothetical protein
VTRPTPTDPEALERQKSVLRTQADYADGIAADWERTAERAAQNLHAPPAVVASAKETAAAHRAAAETIRAQLSALDAMAALDALDAERAEPTYTRAELLYAVTRGDAEGYLQQRLNASAGGPGIEAPSDDLVDAFAEALQRTIDRDESWGALLEAACDATWEVFAPKHGLLETNPDA